MPSCRRSSWYKLFYMVRGVANNINGDRYKILETVFFWSNFIETIISGKKSHKGNAK